MPEQGKEKRMKQHYHHHHHRRHHHHWQVQINEIGVLRPFEVGVCPVEVGVRPVEIEIPHVEVGVRPVVRQEEVEHWYSYSHFHLEY